MKKKSGDELSYFGLGDELSGDYCPRFVNLGTNCPGDKNSGDELSAIHLTSSPSGFTRIDLLSVTGIFFLFCLFTM
jgi:hypothetical protein